MGCVLSTEYSHIWENRLSVMKLHGETRHRSTTENWSNQQVIWSELTVTSVVCAFSTRRFMSLSFWVACVFSSSRDSPTCSKRLTLSSGSVLSTSEEFACFEFPWDPVFSESFNTIAGIVWAVLNFEVFWRLKRQCCCEVSWDFVWDNI